MLPSLPGPKKFVWRMAFRAATRPVQIVQAAAAFVGSSRAHVGIAPADAPEQVNMKRQGVAMVDVSTAAQVTMQSETHFGRNGP